MANFESNLHMARFGDYSAIMNSGAMMNHPVPVPPAMSMGHDSQQTWQKAFLSLNEARIEAHKIDQLNQNKKSDLHSAEDFLFLQAINDLQDIWTAYEDGIRLFNNLEMSDKQNEIKDRAIGRLLAGLKQHLLAQKYFFLAVDKSPKDAVKYLKWLEQDGITSLSNLAEAVNRFNAIYSSSLDPSFADLIVIGFDDAKFDKVVECASCKQQMSSVKGEPVRDDLDHIDLTDGGGGRLGATGGSRSAAGRNRQKTAEADEGIKKEGSDGEDNRLHDADTDEEDLKCDDLIKVNSTAGDDSKQHGQLDAVFDVEPVVKLEEDDMLDEDDVLGNDLDNQEDLKAFLDDNSFDDRDHSGHEEEEEQEEDDPPKKTKRKRGRYAKKRDELQGSKEELKCKFCEKVFPKKYRLEVHMRSHTGEKPYICEICSMSFADKGGLRRHQHMHTGTGYKKYKCDLCDKSYSHYNNLKEHRTLHTGEALYMCTTCGKDFRFYSHFLKHMKKHSGGAAVPKVKKQRGGGAHAVGGKLDQLKGAAGVSSTATAASADGGATAIKTDAAGVPAELFQCKLCPKTYVHQGALMNHERRHAKEGPDGEKAVYKCEVCGKVLSNKYILKFHMRTHTGDLPFECESCGKRFNSKINLERHMLVHVEEKNFQCDVCGKWFAGQFYLDAHKIVHTDQKFPCDVCHRVFNTKTPMYKHRKSHFKDQS